MKPSSGKSECTNKIGVYDTVARKTTDITAASDTLKAEGHTHTHTL